MIPRNQVSLRGLAGAAIFLAVAGCLSGCRARAASCDLCGRDECTALTFRVEYADGGEQVTCCPRCASHAVAESGGREVARLVARDFATGREIDARVATFVDGSDVEHCSAPKEQRAEPGCCRELAYDRCLPSLIAFGDPAAAERFARDHGGIRRSFPELGFGRR